MTHVIVTRYVESWQGKSITALHPGTFPYAFVCEMLGDAFVQERLADGTLLPLTLEETA